MSIGQTVLPYLSVTALASTVGLFLCGLQICKRIKQRGTTDGTSPAPFLLPFISCAFFIQYGFLKNDNVIITTNMIGYMMQTCYVSYYYFKTRNRRLLNKVILLELILILLMIAYTSYLDIPKPTIIRNLGNVCILLNIASVGSPLLDIGNVIRSKSSESLPLPMCIACFLVSIQWLCYGLIVGDTVITFPNIIATIISIIQLSLFIIYPSTPSYSKIQQVNNI